MELQQFIPRYSGHFDTMVKNSERCRELDHPDGHGTRTGDCGDTVEMFIDVEDKTLKTVTFCIKGCRYTKASANTVSLLTEGKTIDNAWKITPEDVANYLEILPPDHFHCAELAVGALYNALADYDHKLTHNA